MGTCPEEIKRLIDHFDLQADQVRAPDYNESQLRVDFAAELTGPSSQAGLKGTDE